MYQLHHAGQNNETQFRIFTLLSSFIQESFHYRYPIATTIYSIQQQQQLSNNNTSTTNYSICDERLFNLGDLSREGYNATVVNNICPDSIFTPIIASIFLTLYLTLALFGTVGVIWKRKSGHIKARNPVYMLLTISASLAFVVITCLRFTISRKIFPCFLYTFSFFIIIPSLCLPTVFRCLRIYFMYLLNKKKAQMFQTKSEKPQQLTSVKKEQNVDQQVQEDDKLKGITILPLASIQHGSSTELSETSQPELLTPKTFDNSSTISNISQENPNDSSQTEQITTTRVITETGEDVHDEQDQKTWVTSSDIDNTSAIFSDKKFKIFSYLVSYKFIAITYTISFIIHLSIWALLGGIDELSYSNSGKRIFLWNVSPFAFNSGCVTTSNTVILLGAEAALYIVIEVSFLIILFFVDRDTWSIKTEAFVLVFIQVALSLAYIISGQIEIIRFLTDYFVPFGFTLLTYSLLEIIISVILPVIYAIRHDNHQAEYAQSELELFLKNRKTFALLLDFATRSYCNEDVLAYRDIENFRKSPKRKNKKLVAMKILKTYLKEGSPLELNIANIDQIYLRIEHEILSVNDDSLIASTLFDIVRVACLNNMTDLFERLKSSNKSVRIIVENWRKANKILQD